jgi:tRNA U34 5-methylaminomethyl-2-thiouridine-forming methyltransferase MnmC
MSALQIITTADGSHTLFNPDLEETYHSKHGAVQESNHVFIAHGLQHWLDQTQKKKLVIFEVGFGTGLNAWLTHELACTRKLQVTYFSVEAFPLQREVWTQLNYAPDDATFTWLHDAPWNVSVARDDEFTICKMAGKLEDVTMPEGIDVVYFDAFAPSKQPHLWTYDILEKVIRGLSPDGIFVTYCARGQLKRDLRALGLNVETLPGPPGKKEMVRASVNRAKG